jgi:hypothetical protein
VVTNYGVSILEVKDWIQVQSADRYQAKIWTRKNRTREVSNPVNQARDIAILLSGELKEIKHKFKSKEQREIPWGYAVVLPNLRTATITQLRHAWGEEFVLNLDDLDPALILSRLKVTLPGNKVRDLKKYELDYIRATINPTVIIEPEHRDPIILDHQQEQIVSEPVKPELIAPEPTTPSLTQEVLFPETQLQEVKPEEELPPGIETRISKNVSIRLVRGIAGSGETLVLTQRARYLAAQYPEWKILVLTFNRALREHLEASLKGIKQIDVNNFHALCRRLIGNHRAWRISSPEEWLDDHHTNYSVIHQLGAAYIEEEFRWIKDTGVMEHNRYLTAARRGRHRQLGKNLRNQVYDVFEAYQAYLEQEKTFDWDDVPHIVLQGIDEGYILPYEYDAVLIDEAQDFAPVWMQVVSHLLFLADDPAQSIYRFYSWREKGIEVVGRTRWLKVPYRNTYEIYQAAYQLIATDEKLLKALQEEGLLVAPDIESSLMRHGSKPLLQSFSSFDDEVLFIRGQIDHLLQTGTDSRRIAVLHRHRNGKEKLKAALQGCDVYINTIHALKGLEFDVVFISQLQETAVKINAEEKRMAERRLVYMAMTRARQQLCMGYHGRLPKKYNGIKEYVDFIG